MKEFHCRCYIADTLHHIGWECPYSDLIDVCTSSLTNEQWTTVGNIICNMYELMKGRLYCHISTFFSTGKWRRNECGTCEIGRSLGNKPVQYAGVAPKSTLNSFSPCIPQVRKTTMLQGIPTATCRGTLASTPHSSRVSGAIMGA